MTEVTVLCVNEETFYRKIHGLDLYDKHRNAYNFSGKNMVITHAPCQQWSARMKVHAKKNKLEKELAFFCLEKVKRNGGIFEHPAHSEFFKAAGIKPTLEVDQMHFGFKAHKRTWLYFKDCEPLYYERKYPQLIGGNTAHKGMMLLSSKRRSDMTLSFAKWLVDCVRGEHEQDFQSCLYDRNVLTKIQDFL